ncbi:hypothetical protein [Planococcus shenhongbingii]|uniref:hypothetical protein n=1 Tax=Planococcus shenhongbingii TaxID=3058398 RepID=UPI00265ABBEA|nr:hypothetical protein [Planococcus sp. N017]
MYYFILVLGIFFVTGGAGYFVHKFINRSLGFLVVGKAVGVLLLGGLCLLVTLPSLKYMLLKEYDVVEGECRIEISAEGRYADATFDMLDKGERFSFTDLPELDAYGKSVPYYCEVTVSKDHLVEIGYKIFDANSRELLETSK